MEVAVVLTLPRTLARWKNQLDVFPEDVAVSIGALASRLAPLFGSQTSTSGTRGEPDGFDGIARRGSYERLLLSEWLLQEELPDEFIRRVSSAEHSFLATSYRARTESRRTVVLFDAGPAQLGGPRLVHLALIVALAERAARSGAELGWGTLQDREQDLYVGGLDPLRATLFLRSRSLHAPTSDDCDRWSPAFEAPLLKRDSRAEVWLVGDDRLAPLAKRVEASLLSVTEVLDPANPARIRVRAHPAARNDTTQRRVREITLELPPPRDAVRILRDPFDVRPARTEKTAFQIDPAGGIVFAPDGRTLYARTRAGDLLSIQIPNSKNDKPRTPRIFKPPSGQKILAVGQRRSKKRTFVVTASDTSVFVHQLTKALNQSTRVRESELIKYLPMAAPHLCPLGIRGDDELGFVDGRFNCVELHDGVVRSLWPAFARAVPKPLLEGLLYQPSLGQEPRTTSMFTPARASSLDGLEETDCVFFGDGNTDEFYVVDKHDRWDLHENKVLVDKLLAAGGSLSFVDSASRTLVGVTRRSSTHGVFFFVALSNDRMRVELCSPDGRVIVASRSTSPIVYAAVSTSTGREIVYITETGALVVHSLSWEADVLMLRGEVES